MKNNIKFISALIKLRISHIMTFRLGFWGPFFIDTSYFLVQIFAFETIYGHVDSIRGWGHGEILIFIGTFSLINALNMTIYFFWCDINSRKNSDWRAGFVSDQAGKSIIANHF